jgi:CheY-like chemotaxis protein
MQGELSAPLNDLVLEAEYLKEQAAENPDLLEHIERILSDVASIRSRVKDVAEGPRSLLGVDEELRSRRYDSVLGEKRVLVVDNEPTLLDTVRDILKARGARISTAKDGATALKLLDQWKLTFDQTEAFDLIISDINLGDATGYDVFSAAKAVNPVLPVILMTGFGYDPHHSIVRASQEGLQSVMFKPFQAQSLIDECKKAIDPDHEATQLQEPADDSAG